MLVMAKTVIMYISYIIFYIIVIYAKKYQIILINSYLIQFLCIPTMNHSILVRTHIAKER